MHFLKAFFCRLQKGGYSSEALRFYSVFLRGAAAFFERFLTVVNIFKKFPRFKTNFFVKFSPYNAKRNGTFFAVPILTF